MKKSIAILAAVFASGTAMAQSSVILYGILDAAVARVDNGTTTNAKVESGLLYTNRFGFKGVEDLGGGLKANFVLEQGFSVDNGTSLGDSQSSLDSTRLNQMFSRNAYVGLSGGFGDVRLGKVWSAFDEMKGASNAVWDSDLSPNGGVFYGGAIGGYTYNPRNSVIYFTPMISGFSAAASYSLGENKTPTVNAGKVAALNLKYAAGPLYVGLGHQAEKATGAVSTKKFSMVNATYDFGVAMLQASVGRQSQDDRRTRDWTLGATVPVSSQLAISGGFARSTDNTAASDSERKGVSLAALYALSKRTSLYAAYHGTRTSNPAVARVETSIYALGVAHTF